MEAQTSVVPIHGSQLHIVDSSDLMVDNDKANAIVQDPPEQQPTPTEFKSLIQQYCMALGPDTVTLPKGLPFRKERLDSLKDINAMLNTVLKTTKL